MIELGNLFDYYHLRRNSAPARCKLNFSWLRLKRRKSFTVKKNRAPDLI